MNTAPDESELDDCGPIYAYLAPSDHQPESTTSADMLPSATAPATTPPPSLPATTTMVAPPPTSSNGTSVQVTPRSPKLNRRLLWKSTIGEEYVNCTSSSNATDRVHGIKRVYEFNQTVTPQCGTVDQDQIMLFTTDFCCKSMIHNNAMGFVSAMLTSICEQGSKTPSYGNNCNKILLEKITSGSVRGMWILLRKILLECAKTIGEGVGDERKVMNYGVHRMQ